MGSFIEINDTLRINKEQGFPEELDLETHLRQPIKLESVENKIFQFKAKPDIRFYKVPPVRNFLVQEINGKWVYWGLCLIESVTHDYLKKGTSGSFKIIRINSPDEMKQAFRLIDTRTELNFF